MAAEGLLWHAHATVHKFTDDQAAELASHLTGSARSARSSRSDTRDSETLAAHLNLPHDRLMHLLAGHDLQPYEITGVHLMAAGLDHEVTEADSNLLTTAGLSRLMSLITVSGGQGVVATATRIGVGDGAGTAAIGDTDLSASAGSTHRQFQIMDATFPSFVNGVLSLQASFGSALANFAWNEWCFDLGAPTVAAGTTVSSPMVNHKTSAGLGTKATGTWVLAGTVTVA